ncbi:MAG: HAMP domain-containing protein [Deltaproteobacteria bacterium]|nr:MAG: HAMP domain-containing protein [Deltaproteobacteria bacterium]
MRYPMMLDRMVRVGNSIGVKFFVLLIFLLILSFGIVIYVNIYFLTSLFREDAVSNAIQVSNIIKRATYHSMLRNHRDDLTDTILSIGKEEIFEGIRIYNKAGRIAFSDRLDELGEFADKKAEQCYVCHAEEPAKGVVPTKDLTRTLISPKGYRVLGLINPIENGPECFNASCHAHSSKEKLLGILDVKLSLEEGDKKIIGTRNKMILYSAILILISALVKGGFIRIMIHKPIKKLNDATKEVANLNLDHKVDIHSRDELGNLAHSFNKMTHQLKEANNAVQDWSSQLENRVKEKTRELEKTQSQLISAERMASMGELSAMVAHEINNPLSGILSYAKVSSKYLNRENIDAETLESVKQNLIFISDETKRCGNIVKSLLVFARKTSGDFKEEHLNIIIDNSIKVIDHSVEMKELVLVKELDQENDVIQCDAGGIQQVLVALIVNSIEATSRGGKITIKTDSSTEKDRIRIMVTDEGKGIPDDVLPSIFEPLFSTKAKNTGLGLSLVQGIVEQHAGVIDVKSKVNEGTTFTIILPRVSAKKENQDRLILSNLIQ